jgi:glutaredoxin
VIKLYQVEWCPHCHRVREVLTELELAYRTINVPLALEKRKEVRKVSGQDLVPVLVDGDLVIPGSDAIIHYLVETYPEPADAAEHADAAAFRDVLRTEAQPGQVLARLRLVFESEGLAVAAEIPGEKLAPGLVETDYTLLLVALPVAAAHAIAFDPTVPAVVTLPVAVYSVDEGTEVAVIRPGSTSWLFGERELIRATSAVAQRLAAALSAL